MEISKAKESNKNRKMIKKTISVLFVPFMLPVSAMFHISISLQISVTFSSNGFLHPGRGVDVPDSFKVR